MIHLQAIAKWFGEQRLFEGLSWHIRGGLSYGLVGPNGAGKTTLLRILCGESSYEGGGMVRGKGVRVGYLPQEVDPFEMGTVIEAVLEGVVGYAAARDRVMTVQDRLASDADYAVDPASLRELARAMERFEALGGDGLTHRARGALGGLGFSDLEIDSPAAQLSGGWLMRAALARLLVEQPDVLLLDEPTNHLDLEALSWLESFLDVYPGTIIAVSHDRYFLDRFPDRIVELTTKGICEYGGGYEAFLEGRRARIEQQRREKVRVDKQRHHLQRFVDRFRAKATKAKQAQARMKMLSRLQSVEVEGDTKGIHLRLPPAGRTGKEVLRVEGVTKAWGDLVIYRDLEMTIWRHMRVALVGPNGAGKSTLLKVLAGVTPVQEGRVIRGGNVRPEYYAQHALEGLDPRLTAYQEAQRAAGEDTVSMIRGTLGALLFRGKAVDKKVAVLSGGEKARLALVKMVLRGPSLLLLDEPTGHLDLLSREMLEEALNAFDGTLVMVSHDRYFINEVATHVLEILPGGRATMYQGDYDAYLYRKSGGDPKVIERLLKGEVVDLKPPGQAERVEADQVRAEGRAEQRARKRVEAERRNAGARRTRPLKQRIAELEAEIASGEARLGEIENLQLDPALYDDNDRVLALAEEHGRLRKRVEKAMSSWESYSLRLEGVEEELAEAAAEQARQS